MKISENFIRDILKDEYKISFQYIYDHSLLIQYLDKKMGAIHGDSKKRRSLANIYAIYSILNFYKDDFYNNSNKMCKRYFPLFTIIRSFLTSGNLFLNSPFTREFNAWFCSLLPHKVLDNN